MKEALLLDILAPLFLVFAAGLFSPRNNDFTFGKGIGLFIGGYVFWILLDQVQLGQAEVREIIFGAVFFFVLVAWARFSLAVSVLIVALWAGLMILVEPAARGLLSDLVDYFYHWAD